MVLWCFLRILSLYNTFFFYTFPCNVCVEIKINIHINSVLYGVYHLLNTSNKFKLRLLVHDAWRIAEKSLDVISKCDNWFVQETTYRSFYISQVNEL